jgi:hypothetical protein
MRPQPRSTMPSHSGFVMLNTESEVGPDHRVPVDLVQLPEARVARNVRIVLSTGPTSFMTFCTQC